MGTSASAPASTAPQQAPAPTSAASGGGGLCPMSPTPPSGSDSDDRLTLQPGSPSRTPAMYWGESAMASGVMSTMFGGGAGGPGMGGAGHIATQMGHMDTMAPSAMATRLPPMDSQGGDGGVLSSMSASIFGSQASQAGPMRTVAPMQTRLPAHMMSGSQAFESRNPAATQNSAWGSALFGSRNPMFSAVGMGSIDEGEASRSFGPPPMVQAATKAPHVEQSGCWWCTDPKASQ
mmetsp:Transcript_151612/g.486508  ORF Transcript_151612/g.486508 Transcript_151612/m.486508 type:complete len:234 (-) Transcript_151612:46-747(-)